MGHVQQHPLGLDQLGGLLACGGQAVALAGEGPGAQGVGLVPGQHGVAAAKVIVFVDLGQILADGGQALDALEDIDLSGFVCLHHFVVGVDDLNFIALLHLRVHAGHDLLGALHIVLVIGGIDPDDKDAALDAALAQAGQVMLAENIGLAAETAGGHVTPNIRMRVKKHKSLLLSNRAGRFPKKRPAVCFDQL